MLVTSLVSVITPEVARWGGWIGLLILRLVLGAGQVRTENVELFLARKLTYDSCWDIGFWVYHLK